MKLALKIGLILLFFKTSLFAQQVIRLSLDEAREIAEQQNPILQIQNNEIGAQKGRYWGEIMPDNPEFGIEFGGIPQGEPYSNYEEKKLFIAQSFRFPTHYVFQHRILNADLQKAEINFEKFKRSLIYQVKEAYFNVLLKNRLVDLAKRNLELSQDFYTKSNRKYELGETNRLTMLKAKVNRGIARKQLNGREKDVEAALSQLRQVIGIKAGELQTIELTDILPETVAEMPLERFRQCLFNHPSLREARTSRQSALNMKRMAISEFLPSITFRYFKQDVERNSLWGSEFGFSMPLFFFGQKGKYTEKSAELTKAENFVEAEKLRIDNEFNQAVANYEKALNEVELYQADLLRVAEEAFRIAQRSYEVGEIGYLEFIDSQKILIQTREGFLQSLFNYQVEKANIVKLVGEEF